MDFVVVGFGLGALGILLGVILRGPLAGRCDRTAARATEPAVTAYERASAADCRGAGEAFLAAGSVVVLATVGGLAGALNDRTGALLVATTATMAALGIILWGYLYRSRNPMPPRPRQQKSLAMMAGATGASFALAAAERPAGAAEADSFEQTPIVEIRGTPGDAEEDSKAPAGETDDPVHAESALAMDNSEAEASSDVGAAASADESRPNVGAAANGRLAGDEVGTDETHVVAFVGRETHGLPEQSLDSGDDAVDDRQFAPLSSAAPSPDPEGIRLPERKHPEGR